jgi:pimeloyl-ACP methyl ester carboxylesterase
MVEAALMGRTLPRGPGAAGDGLVTAEGLDRSAPPADHRPMSMPGPASHTYFSQRLRLHYVDWGNPDKPPLVLLHGGRDHCRNWDWVAQALRADWHIIAPDLRGHGDSQWSTNGSYDMAGYVYDLAQLIHQQRLAPVTIIAHSLGGNITLRYAGIYPEAVSRLVAIEGLGPSRAFVTERAAIDFSRRMDEWVQGQRALAGRLPRRYPSIEDAFRRMQDENPHLTAEQARHLTVHGVSQNEDGTYSWKFDNYVRAWPPYDMRGKDIQALWARINCPTLLLYGSESRAGNPESDGRARHFRNARVIGIDRAGHWLHHDRLDEFLRIVREFLAS